MLRFEHTVYVDTSLHIATPWECVHGEKESANHHFLPTIWKRILNPLDLTEKSEWNFTLADFASAMSDWSPDGFRPQNLKQERKYLVIEKLGLI